MRGNSPVLAVVVFLWEIFLVVSEEGIELDALFEVLYGFEAADVLQEIEGLGRFRARSGRNLFLALIGP